MLFQAVDAADQGGFARSRWATNDDALALANVQVNVAQHMKLAKPFVDFFEGDDGLWVHGGGVLGGRAFSGLGCVAAGVRPTSCSVTWQNKTQNKSG